MWLYELSDIKIIKSGISNFIKIIKRDKQHGPNIELGLSQSVLKKKSFHFDDIG